MLESSTVSPFLFESLKTLKTFNGFSPLDRETRNTTNVPDTVMSDLAEADHTTIANTVKNVLDEQLTKLASPLLPSAVKSQTVSIKTEITLLLNSLVSSVETSLTPVPASPHVVNCDGFSFTIFPGDCNPKQNDKISLRGLFIPKAQLSHVSRNLFELYDDSDVEDSETLGTFQGKWGMTDQAFLSPAGVLSNFHYTVHKNEKDFDDTESDSKHASVMLTGYFLVRSNNLKHPFVKVAENSLILTLHLKTDSKTEKDNSRAEVVGRGENQYGMFNLRGFYDLKTQTFSLYREYTTLKQKVSAASNTKRKSTNTTAVSTAKKRHKLSHSLLPIETSPIVVSNSNNNINNAYEETRPERERKTPSYLKEPAENTLTSFTATGTELDLILKLVNKLIASDKEGWFIYPVDHVKLNLPTYLSIITTPMDLGTVSSKLSSKAYSQNRNPHQAFCAAVDDIRLVFHNAMKFNPPTHPVHKVANAHLKLFERDLKQLQKQITNTHKTNKLKSLNKKKKIAKNKFENNSLASFALENAVSGFNNNSNTFANFDYSATSPFGNNNGNNLGASFAAMKNDTDLKQLEFLKKQSQLQKESEKIQNLFSSSDEEDSSSSTDSSSESENEAENNNKATNGKKNSSSKSGKNSNANNGKTTAKKGKLSKKEQQQEEQALLEKQKEKKKKKKRKEHKKSELKTLKVTLMALQNAMEQNSLQFQQMLNEQQKERQILLQQSAALQRQQFTQNVPQFQPNTQTNVSTLQQQQQQQKNRSLAQNKKPKKSDLVPSTSSQVTNFSNLAETANNGNTSDALFQRTFQPLHQPLNSTSVQNATSHISAQQPPTIGNNQQTRKYKKREEKDLSYQEKRQLGQDVNKLPEHSLPAMLEMLREAGANLGDGEEIELDMENLATPVLRKLQKFVRKQLAENKLGASIEDLHWESD